QLPNAIRAAPQLVVVESGLGVVTRVALRRGAQADVLQIDCLRGFALGRQPALEEATCPHGIAAILADMLHPPIDRIWTEGARVAPAGSCSEVQVVASP